MPGRPCRADRRGIPSAAENCRVRILSPITTDQFPEKGCGEQNADYWQLSGGYVCSRLKSLRQTQKAGAYYHHEKCPIKKPIEAT